MHGSALSLPFELTPLRLVWLCLALIGAGIGIWAPAPLGASEGLAMAVLALWCLIETSVRRNWAAFLTLPALWLGLGCALPLYLFIRSRRIV